MYYQNLRKGLVKKQKEGPKSRSVAGNNDSKQSIPEPAAQTSFNSGKSIGAGSAQEPKPTNLTSAPSINSIPENEEAMMNPKEILSKLQLSDESALKRRIHDYYRERKSLRRILDSFQKEFFKIYNRKLRFTKDIQPVANEFKRYKELKKEIQRLEGLLKKLE